MSIAGSSSSSFSKNEATSGTKNEATFYATGGVDEVFNLLSEWGLTGLHELFEEHEIGISSLKYLTHSEIKELIPKIGHRTLFCAKLQEWRESQCLPEEQKSSMLVWNSETAEKSCTKKRRRPTNDCDDSHDDLSIVKIEEPEITEPFSDCNAQNINESQCHDVNSNEFSVFEWLSHDADGQCVLDSYNMYNSLGNEQRKNVLKIIAKLMANQELPKSLTVLEQISTQLTRLFPTEHYTSSDLLRSFTQIENGIEPDTCNEIIRGCPETAEDAGVVFWTQKKTKYLVKLYFERRQKFRDPKHKKKKLWLEMCNIMKSAGYTGVTEEILDRKIRNMKKTYRTIKENIKQNGRGRVKWPFYEDFEEIFEENQTVNTVFTVSSMEMFEADVPSAGVFTPFLDGSQSPSCSSYTSFCEDNPSTPSASHVSLKENSTTHIIPKLQKAGMVRDTYENRRMELERSRVEAIETLNRKMDESIKVQKERNEILNKMLEKLF